MHNVAVSCAHHRDGASKGSGQHRRELGRSSGLVCGLAELEALNVPAQGTMKHKTLVRILWMREEWSEEMFG